MFERWTQNNLVTMQHSMLGRVVSTRQQKSNPTHEMLEEA